MGILQLSPKNSCLINLPNMVKRGENDINRSMKDWKSGHKIKGEIWTNEWTGHYKTYWPCKTITFLFTVLVLSSEWKCKFSIDWIREYMKYSYIVDIILPSIMYCLISVLHYCTCTASYYYLHSYFLILFMEQYPSTSLRLAYIYSTQFG